MNLHRAVSSADQWWMKAVCRDGFYILVVRKSGRIVAGLPLPFSRNLGLTRVTMPEFTQTMGVLLLPTTKKTYEDRLSEEMQIMDAIIEAIPRFNHFSLAFHFSVTNWLPFYWAGYKQTTRYTYLIDDLSDMNKVLSNFAYSKRQNIARAKQLVTVHENLLPEQFYNNHKLTLAKQGEKIEYSFDLFKRIYQAAQEHSAGRTWFATDAQGNIHAAIFVVYDHKSAYYLINTIDPDYRRSGATTLLVNEAINYLSKYTKRFDFEGSMIRGVENSFRRFGAIQTPYFSITRDNRSIPLKLIDNLLSKASSANYSFNKFLSKDKKSNLMG